MSGVNKAIIIGRLGKDPEVKTTPTGKKCALMSIATSEKINGIEKVEWHRVVVWEQKAELAEKYLKKGSYVYIEGKIQTREYEDKQNGIKRFVTEIIVNKIEIPFPNNVQASKEEIKTTQSEILNYANEDVPF